MTLFHLTSTVSVLRYALIFVLLILVLLIGKKRDPGFDISGDEGAVAGDGADNLRSLICRLSLSRESLL